MATSLEDITSLRLWKGIAAEFIGVLLLVLVGCGSCVSVVDGQKSSVVQIALCFGLSVATIVWNIAHVSGGHINPAVTLAMLATRKISLAKAIFFVLFQLAGGVVGAALLMGMTPEDYRDKLGATLLAEPVDAGKGVGVEIFITFVLVFTVFASVDSRRRDLNGSAPLSIGLSVAMCHLFAVSSLVCVVLLLLLSSIVSSVYVFVNIVEVIIVIIAVIIIAVVGAVSNIAFHYHCLFQYAYIYLSFVFLLF